MDVIAHRGGSGYRVENSMAAFQHAIAIGCDGAELDVHLTQDGQVVIHHNPNFHLGYTRLNGDWVGSDIEKLHFKDLNYAEIAQYDIGQVNPNHAYAQRFPFIQTATNQRIPLLSDLLALVSTTAPKFKLIIEIKAAIFDETAEKAYLLADKVCELLARYPDIDACLCGFDWRPLRYAKQRYGKTIWLTTYPFGYYADVFQQMDDLSPKASFLQKIRSHIQRGSLPWQDGFMPDSPVDFAQCVADAGGDAWFAYYNSAWQVSELDWKDNSVNKAVWSVDLRNESALQRLTQLGVSALCVDYPMCSDVERDDAIEALAKQPS